MLSHLLTPILLAGVASAVTPSSFSPASSNDLVVAFSNTLAMNGVLLPKDSTQKVPTIGTAKRLNGTYAVMMIDLDIPSRNGGATSTLLHWLQTDLVSANASTTINGMKVFELINPNNVAAVAPYFGPSPPNRAPVSHRYTQILVDTTSLGSTKGKNGTGISALAQAGATRGNFSASAVVQAVGVKVVAGNSFNVTSPEASGGSGSGSGSKGNGTSTGGATESGRGSGAGRSNSTVTTSGPPGVSEATGVSTGGAGASATALPSNAQQVGTGIILASTLAFGAALYLL